MKFSYSVAGQSYTIELEKTREGYRTMMNGETREVTIAGDDPAEFVIASDGEQHLLRVASDGSRQWVWYDGRTFVVEAGHPGKPSRGTSTDAHASDNTLYSPMPGQVRAVQVKQGDAVERGQTLMIVEAMKMEIRIQAPHAGRVAKILVKQGQLVERERGLIEIE